ncbi:serine/threonine-protein kinase [Candidatus Uabimicrobium amorphum]|uniref:non-specific serine/threonine protein kinase n=1 Tax=Uabimicrobium amorphum TaxID=2596890 RepID=A0A5S9F6N4_UABAM|nr:serine/threonine-protein kinase [Candidatus Uabimicrobium amorphum]BBM87541.1 protein kinase [Candidatus Uabimicrobium amorphum]
MQNDPKKEGKSKPQNVLPLNTNHTEDKTAVYHQPFSANVEDKTVVYQQKRDTHPLSETQQRELQATHTFANYRIIQKIGQGGMGVVYKAEDLRLSRIVAIKLISKDVLQEKEVQRFLTEAKANAKLQHPGIVRLLDVGHQPQNYLTMEYVEGVTLKQLIYQRKVTPQNSINILVQLAEALQYAHDMGIIHRDIKPENIMIHRSGRPKIMDFGLAKIVDSDTQLSQTGDIMGTPAYMSPEQVNGSTITTRTDIYSLGATLYEILTLRPMFEGQNRVNLWYKILKDDPIWPRQLNPDISSDLEAICIKCLHKNPEKRYKSMQELASDLRNFQQKKPIIAKSPTAFTHIQKFILRHLAASITITAILLSIVTGGVFSYYQWQIAKEQRQIAEREKTEKTQEARNSKIRLAKIALTKCAESYKNGNWAQSGIFAGAALDFIKDYSGSDIDRLRSHTQTWLKQSIQQHGVLWTNQKNAVGLSQVNFSHNGRYVVTCSGKRVRVWNSFAGTILRHFTAKTEVFHVSFSHDDTKIIWSTKNNIVVMDITLKSRVYEKNIADIKLLRVHPKKNTIAFASKNRVQLLDFPQGSSTAIQETYKWINDIQFHKEGKLLGIAAAKEIHVWNLNDNTQRKYKSRRNSITSFTFSDDAQQLTAVYDYKIVRLWYLKTDTYRDLFSIEQAKKAVLHAASNSVIVAYKDKLTSWNLDSRQFSQTYKNHNDTINDFSINPKGNSIVSVSEDGSICCWKLSKIEYMQKSDDIAFAYLKFNTKEDRILAHIPDKKRIQVWDVNSRKKLYSWPVARLDVPWIFVSPYRLAIAQRRKVQIYDVKSGQNTRTMHLYKKKEEIQQMHINAQKNKLLTVVENNHVHVWDFSTKKRIDNCKTKFAIIRCAWSNNEKLFAYSKETDVAIVDLETKKEKTIHQHSNWAQALAFSADNKLLAAAFVDHQVKIWEIASGKCIQTISQDNFSNHLQFLSAGRLLSITIKGEMIIWDTKFGTPLRFIPSTGASLSASEQRIATVQNSNLVVWHLEHDKRLPNNFVRWADDFIKKNKYSLTKRSSFFDFRRDIPGIVIEQAIKDQPFQLCQYLFRQQVTEELSTKNWDGQYE